jgi:NADPH:quinone reductase-like Zn-dependent oxidoreductase
MLNKIVKIAYFNETGGPEVLQLEKIPLPEPGKGEIRLRVHAIGLNRADVMFCRGKYLIEPKFPSKIGYEASGIVEAVGPDVDKQLLGKKCSTVPCFNPGQYGVYGEVAILPLFAITKYPEKLSFVEATAIWMQYITAYGALVHHARLTKGDFVVITAASSSVGLAAIEVARAQGSVSIAATRTSQKKEKLLALGANHVIVTNDEDLPTRVDEITGGKRARIVFDPVAGEGVKKLAKAVAASGTLFVYGNLSMEATPFPLFTALARGLSMRGYTMFEIVSDPKLRAEAETYIYSHLEDGTFKPKIARTFPFEDIVDAYRYMESNQQIGKIVATVDA